MKFTHHDLGHRSRGEIVQINLSGSAANVLLLDNSNLHNYRAGGRFRYVGGLAGRSPVRLVIPNSGHWHVAVDLRGLRGSVRSSVQILPAALPPLREVPLSSIPSLVRDTSDDVPSAPIADDRLHDVFISHASEDKDEIVRPLAHALQDEGLSVWYDEFELRIGDSLRRKIDAGLAHSRFGVVVLSTHFLGKGWPNYELDGLVTRAVSGEQIILPIWHNITKQEVMDYSPSLADKLARSTVTHTVSEIATEIAGVIRQPRA